MQIIQKVTLLLVVVFLSNRDVYCLSTWAGAVRDCDQQCLEIESDTVALQQHFKDTNERFWLPKAQFVSPWIEQVGCSSTISKDQEITHNVASLGLCYHICSKTNASYFAYKENDCVCSPNINDKNRLSASENLKCDWFIYKILDNQYIAGTGECAVTKCKYDQGKYVRDTFKATECTASNTINGVCGDAKSVGYNLAQPYVMQQCNRRGSYLPGTNDTSCKSIKNRNQGAETTIMWSSVFKTRFVRKAHFDENPDNCISGRFVDKIKIEYIEEVKNCGKKLSFICKVNATNCTRQENGSEKSSSVAMYIGVTCGVIFPVAILVLVLVIWKKRLLSRVKQPSDNNYLNAQPTVTEACDNVDVHDTRIRIRSTPEHRNGAFNNDEYAVISKYDKKSRPPRNCNAPIRTSQTPEHLKGAFNNDKHDEYAVVSKHHKKSRLPRNRNTQIRIDSTHEHLKGAINDAEYAMISKPDKNSRVPVNTNSNTDGILYLSPPSEYDKLDHSNRRQLCPPDESYSACSNYNTANFGIEQNKRLDEYDHVTSNSNQNVIDV